MAFRLFGSNASPIEKLLGGKAKEEEKAQLLQALAQADAVELIPLLTAEDAALQTRGAQLFLAKADARAVAALLEDMLGRPQGTAVSVRLLQKCKPDFVVAAVDPLLAQRRPETARRLWEVAVDLGGPAGERYAERALREAPPGPRLAALRRALKARGAEALRAVLLETATNADLALRKEALVALAPLPGDDIASLMLDRLGADDAKEVRDFAAKYVQQHLTQAPPEVRPKMLAKLLLAGDPEQRVQLVRGMFAQGQSDELLLGMLRFAKTLTGQQHRTVMEALAAVGQTLLPTALAVLGVADADLRVQAIYLLEAIADQRAAGPLVKLLRDPDWWVRIVVCETLGRLKDPAVVQPLRALFDDADAKWAAIEAVGRIGGEAASAALLPLLRDATAEVRAAAVDTLRALRDARIQPALAELASKDPSVDVRLKAVEALRALQGKARSSGVVVTSQELTKPLEKMLAYARERGASDLHITPGEPPLLRTQGALERLNAQRVDADTASRLLLDMLDPVRRPLLEQHGAVDFCVAIPGVGRYRTNLFRTRRGLAATFRTIPNHPPTFEELGLPKHLTDLGTYHQGICLVTGPAGSGKSTTLAAFVNLINETRASHVLTFEDPVEFLHPPKKALINQREIGRDTSSYATAMRGALREDPDVIVVGDMRDPETIRLALLAAETGHLVIATMQTTGAVATIDKLVESFPADEQEQVRSALAESLKLVVSQLLVPLAEGSGRTGVFEVLKSTSSVRSLIREGKTLQLPSAMIIGRSLGMQTLDGALEDCVRAGRITFERALAFAESREQFLKLRGTLPPPATPARPSTRRA